MEWEPITKQGSGESLVQFQSEVNPEDHGWFVDESNDQLDIQWMRCNPAPDEV